MPTVLKIGPFRLHFYSDESGEPPHIHVRDANGEYKFWLEPVALARNRSITMHDLCKIEWLTLKHKQALID